MKPLLLTAVAILSIAAKAPQDFGPAPDLEGAKADAERGVKVFLKDEDSAHFRYRDEPLKLGKKGWFVCGQVNAKNSYGGYSGFQTFSATVNPGEEVYVKIAPVGLGFNECFRKSLAPPVSE